MTTWGDRAYEFSMTLESSFSRAMESMIFEGQKFGDVMKNVFREIAMEAMRIAFIQPAAKGLAGGLTLGIGSFLGGLFGGGGTSGTTGYGGMPDYGAPMQHGGIASGPKHIFVEPGIEEAFVPLSGGRAIPVEINSRSAGGGGDVIIQIDNRGVVPLNVLSKSVTKNDEATTVKFVVNNFHKNGDIRKLFQEAGRV